MGCDQLPEAAELSRAEQAIVDILTLPYLENLKFEENKQGRWELTRSGELVFSASLNEKKHFGCVIDPRSVIMQKRYGLIGYLLLAIKLADNNKWLQTFGDFIPLEKSREDIRPGKRLWDRFLTLGIATKLDGEESMIINLSNFDLNKLTTMAEAEFSRINQLAVNEPERQALIVLAIDFIYERLSHPESGEI